MATAARIDPYRGYNFRIELDNTNVASFRECGGLSLNTDPVDYREGTDAHLSVRKLTGLRKFTNITLKRGYTQNEDLWKWYKKRAQWSLRSQERGGGFYRMNSITTCCVGISPTPGSANGRARR